MFGNHKLHTIEPEFVIDLGVPAFAILAPSDPLIACIPKKSGNVVIYRELEKHKEFQRSMFSNSWPDWYFSFNGEFLVSNELGSVCFWDFDGKLIREMRFPTYEHCAFSSCFMPDGTFIYLGPHSEKQLDHFVIAVWPSDLSIDKLGRFEFASDIQDFKIWTGAGIRLVKRKEIILIYRADGHGAESEDFLLDVKEGRISLTKAFGASRHVNTVCCAPSGTHITLAENIHTENESHAGRVRCVSLPDFKELGETLHWPAVPVDMNWDWDAVVDCDSITDDLVAFKTDWGRIFLVCTNKMRVVGEIQTTGYEIAPCSPNNPNMMAESPLDDVQRYQDEYLLASYSNLPLASDSNQNTSLAFLSINSIKQCGK